MITIEEAQLILDEIAEELPHEFFKDLNGGILLLPDKKISKEALEDDLFTMGEYCHSSSMGRYITIYFGSFEGIYKNASREKMKKELKKTLLHEFTHHLESLAGERDLEIEDEIQLKKYRERHKI